MNKKKRLYAGWFIGLLFLFFSSWQLISHFYDQQVLNQHEEFLQQKTYSFIRLIENDQANFEEIATDYVEDSEERITRIDSEGDILFDTFNPALSGSRSQRPEVKAVMEGNSFGQSLRMSPTLDQEVLYVAIPLRQNGDIREIIRMAEPSSSFLPEANQMKQAIFLVNLAFWMILAISIFVILRRRNRPVETILPVIKQIINKPKQQKMIMQTSSVWRELYQNINTLSQQMGDTYHAYTSSEKQFYTLLDELMVGVFIIDDNGKLIFINQALIKQLNIKNYKEEQPFETVITEPQFIQMVYQSNKSNTLNKEIRISNSNRLLDVTIRTFKDSGYVFGVSYDMTRIAQLEKLQKDFVGNVTHELKTPVTSLIGFTETLLDGAKEDPQTLDSFLQIMQKDAYRLQSLVQEIIQLSKTSEINEATTSVNINHLIEEIIYDYTTMMTQKNVNIEVNGSKDLVFNTNIELFQPICKNLIENAIHYAFYNGQITITFYSKDGHLILSVEDDGIGISYEEQERIFERFYRVDKARSRNSGGNGLGLAIVNDYSKLLGGKVEIDSFPGMGAKFIVTLPLS
ncbi:ATP-binding protein [Tetragenococcus muriaticus]|uniref:histidine kinase n=1 Tax=Tetragenococcus muriaticus 3MR10-3 TaxID=1302648 RepID=A0A091C0G3_9ENTE|nr:ATP-binding protein [Tetragenococcus muriaticus]KFN90409.1 phosphate regulon sensor protein [Tetragenococcus muriaticus 3MR10-3]GMA45820.1 two-component sensor histidine kinase [Tetragenococcus muriaticus]GMA46810.1 two-component sensor histidine kinase [Tetragenococcus muriaticus]